MYQFFGPASKMSYQSSDRGYKGDRRELLGDLESGYLTKGQSSDPSANPDQKTKLLATTKRLEGTTDTLTRTQQVLHNTVQQGAETMVTLHGQGETIKGSITRLDTVNENIGQGRRLIRQMNQKIMTNKLIVAGIIAILVLVIIVVIVFKWA